MASQKVHNSLLGSYKVKATQTADDENVQHVILADSNGNALTSIPVTFTESGNDNATPSNVPASASSVLILDANTSRMGASVHNDSTAILYLKFGSSASSTSFTVKMQADGYYEVPFSYTGIITGVWASATGSARVTEITP